MVHLDESTYWGDTFERFLHSSGKLTVRSVKLFADGMDRLERCSRSNLISGEGALGSFGAALLEPYADNPATRGILIYPESTITELVEQFVKNVRVQMPQVWL
jgi:hypothetical protein